MLSRCARRPSALFVFLLFASRAEAGFAGTNVFIPATARSAGVGGSQFYSTLWVTNLGSAPANVTIQFLRQGQTNPTPTTRTEAIALGATQRIDDVVTYLGESGGGALHIVSDQEVFASSRTYDQPPGTLLKDVKALFFAGIPAGFALGAGDVSRLQGISNGPLENFRYNFGLVEATGQPVSVRVTVKDAAGASLGTQQYDLGAFEARQVNAFAGFSPAISTTNAILLAEVLSGAGKVLLYGTQIAGTSDVPGSNDAAGFEMSFKDSLLGVGVTSLNGLTGALTIAAGANTTVSQAGSTITIDAVGSGGGGLTAVAHDGTLVGSGTSGSKLAVAVPLSLSAVGVDVVTAGSSGASVAGFYGLTQSNSGFGVHGHSNNYNTDGYLGGNDYGALGVATDANGTGVLGQANSGAGVSGVSSSGFGVHGQSSTGDGVYGTTNGPSPAAGVHGRSGAGEGYLGAPFSGVLANAMGGTGDGVDAYATSGVGVFALTQDGDGVQGKSLSGLGVYGASAANNAIEGWTSGGNAAGVVGHAAGGTTGYLGGPGYGVFSHGAFLGDGAKYFVEPHPTDPTKEIRYVCLEGPEAGTYFRGTARIRGGVATIEVPEDFRIVTSESGLTVQVTPNGDLAMLACVSKDLNRIVIKGSADVEFDYTVNGVRRAFADHQPIVENRMFVPHGKDDTFAKALPAESVRRLVANGILNADGSVNEDTARRLGWDQRPEWIAREKRKEMEKAQLRLPAR